MNLKQTSVNHHFITYRSDDIPALANVAIGKINQTNPGVVRGIDSVSALNPDADRKDLRLADEMCSFKSYKFSSGWRDW